ncbi:MAG: alpha/beta fold hydrolase [Mesorhizobium sp.]|nr:MAG: alpha/beta fold hydrolase [Mesorhizobium sp.]
MAEDIENAVSRRRTFAIIAHPDAGKTTLTEKLLLFGGAIQLAGEVKAKKDRIQTRSDWMKIERERGISVVTSVMTFEYDDNVFNLLDTPGHEDFADDTYRTLSAVDSAVMVIDAAKGIEPRTLKLFEVCRLRDIPIITFVNKMDRESRDPFEILDEIEQKLALDTAPVTWPIGRGKTFSGTYHLALNAVRKSDDEKERTPVNGPDSNRVAGLLPENERNDFIEELELAREACRPLDIDAFREGHLTPVYFGSALRNFGVRDLIEALGAGPAYVFGTSGGAQIGLNLAARHPGQVRALVAHEPPSMMLLDDPSHALAGMRDLHDTYRSQGVGAAMRKFFSENGLSEGPDQGEAGPNDAETQDAPPPFEPTPEEAETFARVSSNFEYWLAHGVMPLSLYRPDVEALRGAAVVVGIGEESVGQPIDGMGKALADRLGVKRAAFPGDHMGFGHYPDRFAETLHLALGGVGA